MMVIAVIPAMVVAVLAVVAVMAVVPVVAVVTVVAVVVAVMVPAVVASAVALATTHVSAASALAVATAPATAPARGLLRVLCEAVAGPLVAAPLGSLPAAVPVALRLPGDASAMRVVAPLAGLLPAAPVAVPTGRGRRGRAGRENHGPQDGGSETGVGDQLPVRRRLPVSGHRADLPFRSSRVRPEAPLPFGNRRSSELMTVVPWRTS